MLSRRSFVLSAGSLIATPALAKMMPVVSTPPDYVSPNASQEKEIEDFFTSSRSDFGGCCGLADGYKQGFEYKLWLQAVLGAPGHYEKIVVLRRAEMRPEGYWVEVFDTYQRKHVWLPVPEKAMVKRPNPTGYYVVWTYYPLNFCQVRCFAPLAQT